MWQQLNALFSGQPKGLHGYMRVVGEDAVDYTIACVSGVPPPARGHAAPNRTRRDLGRVPAGGPAKPQHGGGLAPHFCRAAAYRMLECFPHTGDRLAEDFRCKTWIPVEKD